MSRNTKTGKKAAGGAGAAGIDVPVVAMSPVLVSHVMKYVEMGLGTLDLDSDAVFGDDARPEAQRAFWGWMLEHEKSHGLGCGAGVADVCRVMGEPVAAAELAIRGLDVPGNVAACVEFLAVYLERVHEGKRPIGLENPKLMWGGNVDVYRMVDVCMERGFCGAVVERCVGAAAMALHANVAEHRRKAKKKLVTVDEVIATACEVLGVTAAELYGNGRNPTVVLARAVGSKVAYELCGMSYPEIAMVVRGPEGNHSTIITAVQRLNQRLAAGENVMLRGGWMPLVWIVDKVRSRAGEMRDGRVGRKR